MLWGYCFLFVNLQNRESFVHCCWLVAWLDCIKELHFDVGYYSGSQKWKRIKIALIVVCICPLCAVLIAENILLAIISIFECLIPDNNLWLYVCTSVRVMVSVWLNENSFTTVAPVRCWNDEKTGLQICCCCRYRGEKKSLQAGSILCTFYLFKLFFELRNVF